MNNDEFENGNFENQKEQENEGSEIIYGEERSESGTEYKVYTKTQPQPQTVSEKNIQYDREPKRKSGAKKAVAVISTTLACLLVLSIAVISGFFIGRVSIDTGKVTVPQLSVAPSEKNGGEKDGDDTEAESAVSVVAPSQSSASVLTVPEIAEKCKPSAVGVMVTQEISTIYGYKYTSNGVGSGFILTSDGYIATNCHVVSGASKVTVVLADGSEHEARVIGTDALTDIGVIKIEADSLPVAELGNSDDLIVGELAVAIGTPADITFAGTVTDGIISAINRDVGLTDDYGKVTKTMTLIQTNATINPGNSGGPLINSKGQVIGINTLKLTEQYEGIGFAIPINGAIKIINQLISDGVVTDRTDSYVTGKAAIGITQYADISERESVYYGIPQGLLVIQINPTSSAYKAGLLRGDVIIGYDGHEIKSSEELNKLKDKNKPGDVITLRIWRDGTGEMDITFALDVLED